MTGLSPIKVNDIVKINGSEEGVVIHITKPLGFTVLKVQTVSGITKTVNRIDVQKLISLPGTTGSPQQTTGTLLLSPEVLKDLSNFDFEEEPCASPPPPPSKKPRFGNDEVPLPDIQAYINSQVNKNTAQKTKSDIRLLLTFIKEKHQNITTEICQLPPKQLNVILCEFFILLKKADGHDYETTSIRSFWASIHRHLKEKVYPRDIFTDVEFQQARATLSAKLKDLKKQGHGNLINKCDHYLMKWGDVSLQHDSNGKEFLSYNERTTKTRTGTDPTGVRPFSRTAWATPETPETCPVKVYKLYAELRPVSYREDSDPFYVSSTTIPNPPPGTTWFKKQRVGKNKLAKIMKTMASKAGLTDSKK
ncbi:hypothetical protein V1264_012523 [Littorina saxatilis]|uniref:DUF3504 domain-containing protein n=1 Tax=Littorina saxatilis TaxID=31220 RepID=A0AAN9C2D4_9CAEN